MIPLIAPYGGGSPGEQPASLKDTSAPALTAKGLTFLGITDAINTPQNDTSNPSLLFQPYVGGRNQQDPSPSGQAIPDRHSIGEYHGKKCLRARYPAGQIGYLRYNSLYIGGEGWDEFGFAASLYIPSDTNEFELLNSSGGKIDGKSFFGINCGAIDCYNPAAEDGDGLTASEWRKGGNDQVNWADDQHGCALGINTMYRENHTYELSLYCHIVGGRQNGTGSNYRFRDYQWSLPSYISGWQDNTSYWTSGKGKALPRGEWLRVEQYVKMDTNAMDGVVEMYINGVLWAWIYNCDLGGWVGDRRTLPGSNFVQRGDGVGGLWPSGGGWKCRAVFCREMLGGGYDAAHTPRKTASYYAAEWAVYADTGSQPQPVEQRDLKTQHIDTTGWQEDWRAGTLSRGTTGIQNSWDQYQYKSGLNSITLVDDNTFGLYPDGAPGRVAEISHGVATSPYSLTTDSEYRCELKDFYGNGGSNIRFGVGTHHFVCVSLLLKSSDWVDLDSASAWFIFWQVERADPLPFDAKWSYALTRDLSTTRGLQFRWKHGQHPASESVISINGGTNITLDRWLDVMLEIVPHRTAGTIRVWHRYQPDLTWTLDDEAISVPTAQWDGTNTDIGILKCGSVRQGTDGAAPLSNSARKYRTSVRIGGTREGADPLQVSDTPALDVIPEPFSFAAVQDAAVSTLVESGIVQITGISDGIPISVVDGEYRVGSAGMATVRLDWRTTSGTINNNEYVQLRRTSSPNGGTSVITTLTVGSSVADWSVTTVAVSDGLLVDVSNVPSATLPTWNDVQGSVYLDAGDGIRRAVSWSPAGYTVVENGVTIEHG